MPRSPGGKLLDIPAQQSTIRGNIDGTRSFSLFRQWWPYSHQASHVTGLCLSYWYCSSHPRFQVPTLQVSSSLDPLLCCCACPTSSPSFLASASCYLSHDHFVFPRSSFPELSFSSLPLLAAISCVIGFSKHLFSLLCCTRSPFLSST